MTIEDKQMLTSQKIQQILAVVGKQKDDQPQLDYTEYDWYKPNSFTPQENQLVKDLADTIAQSAGKTLTKLTRKIYQSAVSEITTLFASRLAIDEKAGYVQLFGEKQNSPIGIFSISLNWAIALANQLLGEDNPIDTKERKLSPLEESLLADASAGIVAALNTSFANLKITPASELAATCQSPFEETLELCAVTIKLSKDEKEICGFQLFFRCDFLKANFTGKKTLAGETKTDPDAALDVLREMNLEVETVFATTNVSLNEMLTLQENDIIVLDKKISDPMDIYIQGRKSFTGFPAKQNGNYAVVIKNKLHPDLL